MSEVHVKQRILEAVRRFDGAPLAEAARGLFDVLGYRSDRTLDLEPNTLDGFEAQFGSIRWPARAKITSGQVAAVDLVFQLTDDEILRSLGQPELVFESRQPIDGSRMESYLLLALDLTGSAYTRSDLAALTRAINRMFPMPVLVLYGYSGRLTLAVVDRRLSKVTQRDVLEKVTLIKDISIASPHRAHVEILYDLSLPALRAEHAITNFNQLHEAWRKALDVGALNKRFYKELANWYFWALRKVQFPVPPGEDPAAAQATAVIRMLTRIIFTWFVKERGLVPEELFDENKVRGLLLELTPETSTYYKAILQNLFFATLNTEMGAGRRFRQHGGAGSRAADHMVPSLYRYEALFRRPGEALDLFKDVPFLNGGLFDCLDRREPDGGAEATIRIDGFSDRSDSPLSVPNELFFGDEQEVNLNTDFGTKQKRYVVRGLVQLLSAYKFTVAENTPVEEEVALDPELLGRVFENLLASYNPETSLTARKQTGSYYTPREIVAYMVDQALLAALEPCLCSAGAPEARERLEQLFAYTETPPAFTDGEEDALIGAIQNLRILDPACGSGAFPMGALHRLVFLLQRLDPGNARWKVEQIRRAETIQDPEERERACRDIESAFERNDLDYGRKLFLIENCIYGVDIQPIATQIARLRCFISLIVDQRVDPALPNNGVRPLPNLETRYVAANTLVYLKRSKQLTLRSEHARELEDEIAAVRRRYLVATTFKTKRRCKDQDRALRRELGTALEADGFPPESAHQVADWDPYDQNRSAEFFDPEWMFGIRDGFDIVLGNPPYVRADAGEKHVAFRKRLVDSGDYETLWEKWDLFIPFVERGYKLLRDGGVETLIVSDAFCHAKYAQKPQTWLLDNATILRLDFFDKAVKIFDAAVHNMIFLVRRGAAPDNVPERRLHTSLELEAAQLLPSAPQRELTYRAFRPDDEGAELQGAGRTIELGDLCYVSFGCRPSSDERVARGRFKVASVVSDRRDDTHPKPYIEGKDIRRWSYTQNRWLEWGTQRSPALWARPTFEELYAVPEKLVAADVSGLQNRVAYDNNGVYHSHTLVSIVPWRFLAGVRNDSIRKKARYADEPRASEFPGREELESASAQYDPKYLAAVVNSAAAAARLRHGRRSLIHLYPEDWRALPVPVASPQEQAALVALVDEILVRRRGDPAADVRDLEAEVDKLVEDLYSSCAQATGHPLTASGRPPPTH